MEFRDRIEMKLCIIKGFDVNFGSVCSSHLSYISHPLSRPMSTKPLVLRVHPLSQVFFLT